MAARTPSVHLLASGMVWPNSSSVSVLDSVAFTAADASALPVKVPPTPLTSTSSAKSGPRRRSATSAERP